MQLAIPYVAIWNNDKGELQKTDVIFVHEKNYKLDEAKHKIEQYVKQFPIEAFAIGDGTAGREDGPRHERGETPVGRRHAGRTEARTSVAAGYKFISPRDS